MGCRRSRRTSRSISASEQARDLVFLNPRFLGMANHLRLFSEAYDGPEWQEQPVQAVGGEGQPCRVT